MNNKIKVALTSIALVASLAACSSSQSAETDSTSSPADPSASTTQVTVVVDEAIKDALNVEPGSAVIPGSIEVTPQELGKVCTDAVAPLRKIMKDFPSVRQVQPVELFNDAMSSAKATCEKESPQEWTDFYTKEVAGWVYAETNNAAASTVPTPTTAP